MRYKKTVMMLTAGLALMTAGCGTKDKAAEITPTPVQVVTVTPTPVPATPTPAPTATAAPRMIGTKTADSKFIYLTNNTQSRLRGIYVKSADSEDWGKNLITGESSVKAAEQVRMYYQPQSGEDAAYDMRFVEANGNTYEIYSVKLSDMERASLKKDSDQGIYYLTYMSLSSKSETDTKNNYTSSYDSGSSGSDSDGGDDGSDVSIQYYDTPGTDDSDSDDSSDDSDYYYDYDVIGGDDSDSGDTDSDGDGNVDSDGDGSSDGSDSDGDGSSDSDDEDSIVWDENGEWSQG